jgi:predicted dehydrogenase
VPDFDDYFTALTATTPDVVSINTYPDTHAPFAMAAIEAGCHVFCEKPIATTLADAEAVVHAARARGVKMVVGYILRVHPAWMRFTEIARTLGKPLVMRMNLNQQSQGAAWRTHQRIMESMSPIVDCGVHYLDVMCQMTGAAPVRVSAVGARLAGDLPDGMYNYGQLQVVFADGSVGWYESGWGPMMSEVAFFVKDVIGPRGSVSIVKQSGDAGSDGGSDDLESHTRTSSLRVHHSALDDNDSFARRDDIISTDDEPSHQELCHREQAYLLRAIKQDLDLTDHLQDAINSLRVVLAADDSVRLGRTIEL